MQKKKIRFLIGVFLSLIILIMPIIATASTGERLSPYSGFVKRTHTIQQYGSESQIIELQLIEVINGDEADLIVQNENMILVIILEGSV